MGHYTEQFWENPYSSGIPRSDRRSGEYRTYSPALLRDLRVSISPELDAKIAAAERAVRSLNRGTHRDLGLVSRFLLRSEAIASSYIEGIAPTPRNVAIAELALEEDITGLSRTAQDVARNMTIVREAWPASKRSRRRGSETPKTWWAGAPPRTGSVDPATTRWTPRMCLHRPTRCGAFSKTSCSTWPARRTHPSSKPPSSMLSSRPSTPSPMGTGAWVAPSSTPCSLVAVSPRTRSFQ